MFASSSFAAMITEMRGGFAGGPSKLSELNGGCSRRARAMSQWRLTHTSVTAPNNTSQIIQPKPIVAFQSPAALPSAATRLSTIITNRANLPDQTHAHPARRETDATKLAHPQRRGYALASRNSTPANRIVPMNTKPTPHQTPSPRTILLISAIPLLITATLFLFDVPYGRPGVLVYHYSPLAARRLTAAAIPILLIALCALISRRLPFPHRISQRAACTLVLLGAVLLGLWTHVAPPAATNQHFFDMRSVAQEGAFVIEAARIESLDAYLRQFPASLSRTVDQLRGARVLSNPPGVTILAYLADRTLLSAPRFSQWIIDAHGGDFSARSPQGHIFAQAMTLVWLFSIAWIAAAAILYALARLWLDPLPAAALTLVCWFNPSTAAFSPGKDPAQLLTIALILWGFFGAWVRRQPLRALIGGMALAIGLAAGLIHAWIFLIALTAMLWAGRSDPPALRRALTHCLLPGAAGAALCLVAARLIWGWNIPVTLFAVTASYFRAADVPPWIWNLAKPPMFALFAGAGFWVLLAATFHRRLTDETARLGNALIWSTLGAILLACPSTALETPRLWVAFLPTLLLGIALSIPMFRQPSPAATKALLTLIASHLITTCLQWCLFDVRESEMRLLTGRLFE